MTTQPTNPADFRQRSQARADATAADPTNRPRWCEEQHDLKVHATHVWVSTYENVQVVFGLCSAHAAEPIEDDHDAVAKIPLPACDWMLADESLCGAESTATFAMPDSDSVDAVTWLCETHAAEFADPTNLFNEGWERIS